MKAVNYDGKMFVIEEVQLFPSREPIKVLKLSEAKVKPMFPQYFISAVLVHLRISHCVCVVHLCVCVCVCVQGHLYAGSVSGAVQIPLATCGRSLSCTDCVLARDPYCGWDQTKAKCISHLHVQR